MIIKIKKYENGIFSHQYEYAYPATDGIETLKAYIFGYESNVDYISNQWKMYYEAP